MVEFALHGDSVSLVSLFCIGSHFKFCNIFDLLTFDGKTIRFIKDFALQKLQQRGKRVIMNYLQVDMVNLYCSIADRNKMAPRIVWVNTAIEFLIFDYVKLCKSFQSSKKVFQVLLVLQSLITGYSDQEGSFPYCLSVKIQQHQKAFFRFGCNLINSQVVLRAYTLILLVLIVPINFLPHSLAQIFCNTQVGQVNNFNTVMDSQVLFICKQRKKHKCYYLIFRESLGTFGRSDPTIIQCSNIAVTKYGTKNCLLLPQFVTIIQDGHYSSAEGVR